MVLDTGKMYRPTDIAIDVNNSTVYVVEQFNHRISKWDYTPPNYIFTIDPTWGNNGDGTTGQGAPVTSITDNALYRPSNIVFDETNNLLYVTDTRHNRVRVIDPSDGSFTFSFGQGGSGNTDFYHPTGIAINTAETVIVIADELNQRAVRYNADANPTFIAELDQPTPIRFTRPHGVTYDVDTDNFIISDSVRGVLGVYDDDASTFVDQEGQPGTIGNNDMFYPGSGHDYQVSNVILFANTRSNQIKQRFMADNYISFYTNPGTGDGQLYWPETFSQSVDTGTPYYLVANTRNNRIEVFDGTFTFQSSFGSPV